MLALIFSVGTQQFALDSRQIRIVLPRPELTPVPQAPSTIAGLFNYHGAIIPVVHLSRLLGGLDSCDFYSTRLVLVNYPTPRGERVLGLLADGVSEPRRIPDEALAPSGITVEQAPYLDRVLPEEAGVVQFITVERLLPSELRDRLFRDQP